MTTLYTERLIIVADAAVVERANDATQPDTFTVPYSPTGHAPVTAYVCNWHMTTEERQVVEAALETMTPDVRIRDAAEWAFGDVLTIEDLREVGL